MKILLDECLPKDLCKSFVDCGCETVSKTGFAGKSNGELLRLAEKAGFDVLLTVDKGLLHQQNLTGRHIALLVIRARSNKLQHLLPYVPACLVALRSIKPEQVVHVGNI